MPVVGSHADAVTSTAADARVAPSGRSRWCRAQVNRAVAGVALLLLLPSVALFERVRRGTGRAVARHGISIVARLCGVRFDVRPSAAPIAGGTTVFVANHASPMDIPAILSAVPDARFLAAAELFRVPLLSSAMRAIGTFPIDRRHPEHGREQIAQLVDDHVPGDPTPLVIFPQGEIAAGARRVPFKSGAFSLAIRTGSALVPVAIHGSSRVLAPHGHLAVRPGIVTIEFLEALPTAGLTMDDRQALRDHAEEMVTAALAAGPP